MDSVDGAADVRLLALIGQSESLDVCRQSAKSSHSSFGRKAAVQLAASVLFVACDAISF
jgi:hypothetical protein